MESEDANKHNFEVSYFSNLIIGISRHHHHQLLPI